MNNLKNLVISSAFGFSSNEISFFVKSLRKYYEEEICFLISPNDNKLKDLLIHYNCKFLETKSHKYDIQLKRYDFYLDILKNNKFNKILHCDSRDIYFQSNPFEFPYEGSINFFLEDEKIKNCSFNSNWLIKTHGKEVFDQMKDNIILCSGTVMATNKSMIEYLKLIKNLIKNKKYKKSLKYLLTFRRDKNGRGCDQAHANFIGHNKLIEDSHFYSNESGPIATVYHLKKIVFDKNSNLLNKTGKPYSIVHQYDKRWDEFSEHVNKIKKNLNIKA